MLGLDNSTSSSAAERLAGHPLTDFRDAISYVNTPLKQQQQQVARLAAGAG
jgi:hypothetical protein